MGCQLSSKMRNQIEPVRKGKHKSSNKLKMIIQLFKNVAA